MNVQNISFLSTHFGSFEWVDLWATQIRQTVPAGLVAELVVINQDRTVEYPRDEEMFKLMGHDHATVLNRAVMEMAGDWVCIMDSDAHPTSLSWLDRIENLLLAHDAVVAEDSGNPGLSHPCFMFLRADHAREGLRFDAGIPGPGADTGRLVGTQLVEHGHKVYVAPARGVFGGLWGALYLESIYHHGHGSFQSAGPRLQCQLTWRDKFYRDRVLNGRRYELSLAELLLVRADWLARGLRTVATRQLRNMPPMLGSPRKIA
jgi:hypothetical protein